MARKWASHQYGKTDPHNWEMRERERPKEKASERKR